MRRIVVTGMGVWSSIGQDVQTVTESLKQGRSGIVFDPKRIEYGLQSGFVGSVPRPDLKPLLPRKTRQTMSEDAEYAYMAARQAFEQANIDDSYLRQNEMGIVWGSEGNSHQQEYGKIMEEERCSALIGYNAAFRSSPSSAVMNLSSIYPLRGINITISAACASSMHALGVAYMLVQNGMQDVILVGGSDELSPEYIPNILIDSVFKGSNINNPVFSICPFDQNTLGSVPTGGAAAVIVEDYEHARARGAKILAEISGYGFASGQGEEIYIHNWEAEYRAMEKVIEYIGISRDDISAIVSPAPGHLLSDQADAKALKKICGTSGIPITATDSITGHGEAISGVARTIYGIIMMQNNFIAPTINLRNVIDEAQDLNIVHEMQEYPIDRVMVSAAGVGGTYGAIIIKKV